MNQVTVLPGPLLSNQLPGDACNRIPNDAHWPNGTGGQTGADSALCLREQPNLKKMGPIPVMGNTEL